MWDKFRLWLLNIGSFLYDFTTTKMGQFMKEYGPRALEIVAEVAILPISGAEKRAKAIAKLLAIVPEILADPDYAAGAVKAAYEIWIRKQEGIDSDGDGVPDYRDLCPSMGNEVSGKVNLDGCPDFDGDGVSDGKDKCPDDPNCQ